MAKIFLTGATGYIGGEVLHQIATAASTKSCTISCLIRDPSKASLVKQAYPDVRIVEGDHNSTELIEKEARDADIVLHLASAGNAPSSQAILRGLSDKSRANGPGYWVQMSGATIVAGPEIKDGRYGEAPSSPTPYDDLHGVEAVRALVAANPARVVDALVLGTAPGDVRTALIAGPCIHGVGAGPVNTRSIQAPEIARVTLQRKRGFRLGKGLNVWSTIHVRDLGKVFVALVEAALAGNEQVWVPHNLYFPEDGKVGFGELCAAIAREAKAQGLIQTDELDEVTAEEANAMTSHGAAIWGTNAVLTSSRAQAQFGWAPSGVSLLDEVPALVRFEAEKLGIKSG